MQRPKEGYNYYVSRSIARLRVAGVNFVYDVEKDDFLKSWRSLSIHSDGFLAARTSRTNERQETCPELTSFGLFTERTKKLAEPTSFRVFTERKRKLAEATRLRILTERAKQRLWLLLIENSRNDVFQPLSRTSKNGSRTKNTVEKNIQAARSNVC